MNFKYTFNKRILSEPSLSTPPAKPDMMAELLYKRNPTWELNDRVNTVENIAEASHFISLPVIAMLGTFASGKTFLLDYLLGDTDFVSGTGTTSSVITVIRHIDSKPADWNQEKNVFSLKKGSPLNTNELIDVSASYYSDEIAKLSTYDYKIDHDVLVVFMDRPILNKMTLVDCPGTGTASEAVNKAEVAGMAAESAAATRAAETREQELQKLAAESSDGLILLSAVGGSGDLFSDAGFKNILSMAAKTITINKDLPVAPFIYIGTLADPQQEGSHDNKVLLNKARESISNRVSDLAGVTNDVIDKIALVDKLVFFYVLSDQKKEDMINMYERALSKNQPEGTDDSLRDSAISMFNEQRGDFERKDDLFLELFRLSDEIQKYTLSRGEKYCSKRLRDSVKHYESRVEQYRKYTIRIPNKNELIRNIDKNEPVFKKTLSLYTSRANSHVDAISEHIHSCVKKHFQMYTSSDTFINHLKSHRRASHEEIFHEIRRGARKDVLASIYDENIILNPTYTGANMQPASLFSWGNIEPEYKGDCHIDEYILSFNEIDPYKYAELSKKVFIEKRLTLMFEDYLNFDVFDKTKAYSLGEIILRVCLLLSGLWILNGFYLLLLVPLVWYWLYGVDVPFANILVRNVTELIKALIKKIFHYRLMISNRTEKSSTAIADSSHVNNVSEETNENLGLQKMNPESNKIREGILSLISKHFIKKKLNRFFESQKYHVDLHTDSLKKDMLNKYKSLVADIQNEMTEKIDDVTVASAKYVAAQEELEKYYVSMKVRVEKTLSILD